jgi:UDP-N-acetylmuramyl tripeptide synthase
MPKIEWFATCFPGRRGDLPVVEVSIEFDGHNENSFPQHVSQIRDLLIVSGLLQAQEEFPFQKLPCDRKDWYTSLLLQTALFFQQKAGHRVGFFSLVPHAEPNLRVGLLEHEHCDVGMTAVKLAAELVSGKRKFLADPFSLFHKFAAERLLPVDTEAIIRAAGKYDIPAIKLERQPYRRVDFDELTGGRCIRRNGLLMLGHGAAQKVLDGTFLLDGGGSRLDLLEDRDCRLDLLRSMDIPVATPEQIPAAGAQRYQLLSVNGCVLAVINESSGESLPPERVNDSIIDLVLSIGKAVGAAPLSVTVAARDLSKPLSRTGDGVLDIDLAPELGFPQDSGRAGVDCAAEEMVDWLFPDKGGTRMPVVAVTGTNGKTTTSRMISHIYSCSGHRPGLVCTTGIYLDGRKIDNEDQCADTGHLKVLTSTEVDVAVLETHHAAIIHRGFAFQWCDVAVCLNVTEDHLGDAHVDTVEQMAEVKRALPEAARHAVVLNADDPHCLEMADKMSADKTCMVSMVLDRESLKTRMGLSAQVFCVLEPDSGEQSVVIHDGETRLPVIAVNEIPVTLNGTAKFNVSNAMHAVAAAHLAGLDGGLIKAAMREFRPEYDANPGRMNVFDDLPFRVVLDFAHNPDGLAKLAAFADEQVIEGRKLIAFAGGRHKSAPVLRSMARPLAGHFDFYYCRDYAPRADETRPDIAHYLREGLLEAGVEENQTALIKYGKKVIFELFDNCRPCDLLVIVVGYVEQHDFPAYISEYAQITSTFGPDQENQC